MNTQTIEKPKLILPNLNCGACGYKTCTEFALAVDDAKVEVRMCIHAKQVSKEERSQSNTLVAWE